MSSKNALIQLLQEEHSRSQTDIIVSQFEHNYILVEDLFYVIEGKEKTLSQRAGWILSVMADQDPQFYKSYVKRLIDLVNGDFHDAVIRGACKLLSRIKINEQYESFYFDTGLRLIQQKQTAVATKVWLIDSLMQIAKRHPDLYNELKFIFTEQIPHSTPGLKNKLLKAIQKINGNFSTHLQQEHRK